MFPSSPDPPKFPAFLRVYLLSSSPSPRWPCTLIHSTSSTGYRGSLGARRALRRHSRTLSGSDRTFASPPPPTAARRSATCVHFTTHVRLPLALNFSAVTSDAHRTSMVVTVMACANQGAIILSAILAKAVCEAFPVKVSHPSSMTGCSFSMISTAAYTFCSTRRLLDSANCRNRANFSPLADPRRGSATSVGAVWSCMAQAV